jgi:hypothetical protein
LDPSRWNCWGWRRLKRHLDIYLISTGLLSPVDTFGLFALLHDADLLHSTRQRDLGMAVALVVYCMSRTVAS